MIQRPKYELQDLSIKNQAYFIIVGLNGSWLYNALYPHIEQEEFCAKIVDNFLSDHAYEDCVTNGINAHINDSYDDILSYQAQQA
jgi:hypothetical protein